MTEQSAYLREFLASVERAPVRLGNETLRAILGDYRSDVAIMSEALRRYAAGEWDGGDGARVALASIVNKSEVS